MDYEKKYKEALKKARQLCLYPTTGPFINDLQNLFPELKESEDELKWLTKFIEEEAYCLSMDIRGDEDRIKLKNLQRSLAWLEKQGEQTSVDKVEPFDKYEGLTDFERTLADICIGWIGEEPGWKEYIKDNADVLLKIAIEKFNSVQDVPFEQKPADEVESKFKVGDWIISDTVSKDYHICKITDIKNGNYTIESTDGYKGCNQFDIFDNAYRLWTIQDAKDGDALTGSKGESILMFRGIGNTEWDDVIDYYCYYDCHREDFIVQENVEYWGNIENNQLKPATKEQHDTLFAKMKEAGYEWNADKKELKKIEQNPTNENPTDVGHEYYSELLNNDDSDTIDEYAYQCAYCMSHDWMKETATWEDVQKAVKLGAEWQKQKPAWSEEDERIYKVIVELLNSWAKGTIGGCIIPTNTDRYINWFKSLKDRVYPKQEWSEEDEHRAEDTIYFLDTAKKHYASTVELDACIDWVKSLKQRIGG